MSQTVFIEKSKALAKRAGIPLHEAMGDLSVAEPELYPSATPEVRHRSREPNIVAETNRFIDRRMVAMPAIRLRDGNGEVRLAEDHANAKRLAEAVANMPAASIDPASVETNIVYFDIDPTHATAQQVCDALKSKNVWMLPIAPQRVRAVTHLDVSADGIDTAMSVLNAVLRSKRQ